MTNESEPIKLPKQMSSSIVLNSETKGEVGRLDAEDGILKFTGDIDEAAKVFFIAVIKQYGEFYKDLEGEIEALKAAFEIYAYHGTTCVYMTSGHYKPCDCGYEEMKIKVENVQK